MERASPLRVALVAGCPFPWPRGTPARILGMAQALHQAGHIVHVIAYPIGDLDRPLPFAVHRSLGLPFYRRTAPGADPLRLAFYLPALAATVARVVARHRIEIVHAHHYEGLLAAWPAKRLHGVPVIYDAHTTLAGELPYYRLGLPRGWTTAVGRSLDARLPKLADHIVATSQLIACELVRDGMPAGRVTVIGNGIEDAFVAAPPREGGPLGGEEQVVYAGNLAGYQGIDTLLEAFALVAADRPATRLVLLTDSSFDRHAALAERLGIRPRIDIEAPPSPQALVQRLGDASLLVNPRAECPGYPLKLLNYMAAGRPIVSFRDSAKGLTQDRDAWLVDEPSAAALARGMLAVLDRPDGGAALGRTARERVVRDLTWSRVLANLEGLYRRMIAHEPPQADEAVSSVLAARSDSGVGHG